MGKKISMKVDRHEVLDPDLPREEWHRRFRAQLDADEREHARAVEADRRWRAAVTHELNRRRGLLGWLGLR